MSEPLVFFGGVPHAVLNRREDWGVPIYDLAAFPRRLRGGDTEGASPIIANVDPYQTRQCLTPGQLLVSDLLDGETWTAVTKRSLARFAACFLVAEDPQRRLDARNVITLAHQVSLVRHILDTPGKNRVLIGDEVGLGKTIVAGLIVKELLDASPALSVLYLAPARLVSNVAREFDRMELYFRQWKSVDGDARLETDSRVIASIHRAVHPNHFDRLLNLRPWDIIIVDECHHLSDWAEGGGDPVRKYRLVEKLVRAQKSPHSRLLLLSGTPHQAHADRFDNLLRLLRAPGEPEESVAGRVIYRTKEDVRDWDGNPLFPLRNVKTPTLVDLSPAYRGWLEAIHEFYQPSATSGSDAVRRAAGWKCAQALQWAASSPNAGLGYLVRQAIRAGWTLKKAGMKEAIAALRPYRGGKDDEPVDLLFNRMIGEIKRQTADADIDDIEDIFDSDDDYETEELSRLIQSGIELVVAPRQEKWLRLWDSILAPSGDEKVVLFAQPIETVMALAAWLFKKTKVRPAIIIGGQSDVERTNQVERFRQPDGPRFLISSRAGGEGINLQFARRLVHLDVPWNPMEMEQRVGRVHRFGSKETVIVDTMVVKDSRETRAWDVARERLHLIAKTLVSTPERFEAVFSRVMCLIPPEELQSVILGAEVSYFEDIDISSLSLMVESGFKEWESFHNRFSNNQKTIRNQPAGLARWGHLKAFLIQYGNAEQVDGVSLVRFSQKGREVAVGSVSADVLRIADDGLFYVGDFEGGLFEGAKVNALGLNVPVVVDLLRKTTQTDKPVGVALLRWAGASKSQLRLRFGEEFIVLMFMRQIIMLESAGSTKEIGAELIGYAFNDQGLHKLDESDRDEIFNLSQHTTARQKPADSLLLRQISNHEGKIITELRRPPEESIRQGIRYAVWPILAAHLIS